MYIEIYLSNVKQCQGMTCHTCRNMLNEKEREEELPTVSLTYSYTRPENRPSLSESRIVFKEQTGSMWHIICRSSLSFDGIYFAWPQMTFRMI